MNKQTVVVLFFSAFVCCIAFSCKATKETSHEIVNVVGEIFPDSIRDHKDFKLCGAQDRIVQYYAFPQKTYEGEKSALVQHFREGFKPVRNSKETGLIRIRFIVNCRGKAGRFRVLSMDPEYRPKVFSKKIAEQLLSLTKELTGWKAMQGGGDYRDYYQYLIFKIEEGRLREIMP